MPASNAYCFKLAVMCDSPGIQIRDCEIELALIIILAAFMQTYRKGLSINSLIFKACFVSMLKLERIILRIVMSCAIESKVSVTIRCTSVEHSSLSSSEKILNKCCSETRLSRSGVLQMSLRQSFAICRSSSSNSIQCYKRQSIF